MRFGNLPGVTRPVRLKYKNSRGMIEAGEEDCARVWE